MKYSQRYLKNRWDAQDAVQDFYEQLLRRSKKGELSVDMPEAYAMAVAKHVVHKFAFTRNKSKVRLTQVTAELPRSIMIDPTHSEEVVQRVVRAFRHLRGRKREVMELVALGWKVDEIARYMVISPETADCHIRNARRILRQQQL